MFTAKNYVDPVLTNLRSLMLSVGQPIMPLKNESRKYVTRTLKLEDGQLLILGWRRRSKRVELAMMIDGGELSCYRSRSPVSRSQSAMEALEAIAMNMTVAELRERRDALGID